MKRLSALLLLAAPWPLAAAPEAAYRQAHACLVSNRFEEAAALFEQAAAATNAEAAAAAWLGRGEALYGAKRWQAAAEAYGALLARFPASALAPNALCGRGFAESQAGRHQQALDTFAELLRSYPQHALAPAAAASTGTLARALADQARQRQEASLARDLAAVNALLSGGRSAEASAAAERALRDHPACAQAAELRFIVADGACRAADWARAEPALRLFLERHPGHASAPRARELLARALSALGRHGEAADAFARLPGADAALRRAEALVQAGRPAEALACYDALAAEASDPAQKARARLAAGDCRAALKQWDEAERAYLSVEVLGADDELRPAALARLAALYDAVGRTNLALRTRAELLRRYPAAAAPR